MNEIAMLAGYATISYVGLLVVLYFMYLPLLALAQKYESPMLEAPLTMLVGLIKIIGTPVVNFAKAISISSN